MRKVFLIVILLVAILPLSAYGQKQPDVGEQIFNSKDKKFLTDGCTLGIDLKNKHLICVTPAPTPTGGGGGADETEPNWTETVTTVISEPYVETVNTIPAGATVDLCTAETLTEVTGGYRLGVGGITDLYARMTGVAGESSRDNRWWSPAHGNYTTAPRRVTSTLGAYVNAGTIEVKCWYREH